MSLHDVLLSLLREPMSGTELIEMFRSSIRHFWTADLSQIYRALESLEGEQCVTSESVPTPRGPARRVYTLTEQGRLRLIDWVRREPQLPNLKFEYLAQLFSVTADENPLERAREQLTALREEAAAAVTVLEGIDAAMSRLPGWPDHLDAHLFYPWLTLRHGLYRRRALLDWVDESLARLDRRGEDEADLDPEAISKLIQMLQSADPSKAERES